FSLLFTSFSFISRTPFLSFETRFFDSLKRPNGRWLISISLGPAVGFQFSVFGFLPKADIAGP
ncbi:hypothetical protein, partial [Desulforamulus ruminis]